MISEYKKMINEEIYVLTKHGGFDANYIESIPVYRRRFFLNLLMVENEKINEENERIINNNKRAN